MALAKKAQPATLYSQLQAAHERLNKMGFFAALPQEDFSITDQIYLCPDDASLRIVVQHSYNTVALSFEQNKEQEWKEIGKMSRAGFASQEALPDDFVAVRPMGKIFARIIHAYDA